MVYCVWAQLESVNDVRCQMSDVRYGTPCGRLRSNTKDAGSAPRDEAEEAKENPILTIPLNLKKLSISLRTLRSTSQTCQRPLRYFLKRPQGVREHLARTLPLNTFS